MLFRLSRDGQETPFSRLEKRSAAELGLEEKDLENWLARHPTLLFGGEQVFVVAQSVRGRSMADLLALDTDGNLVIVEIKRDWSDRETVGQLLEYAADTWNWAYGQLDALYQAFRNDDSPVSVLDGFRRLSDNEGAEEDDVPKGYRLCIVAPESDDGLKRIIRWLQQFGVPISFIPFALYADVESEEEEILLEIEQLRRDDPRSPAAAVGEWHGDWIHNTNESNAPGAYKRMFDEGVVAIYGYETGPDNLEGTSEGQRVFAYVNGKGILAVGHIVDGEVTPGTSVFGEEREYHLKVEWESIVEDDRGVTNADVRAEFNHGLPVRNTFCGLYRQGMPDWIAQKLRDRAP